MASVSLPLWISLGTWTWFGAPSLFGSDPPPKEGSHSPLVRAADGPSFQRDVLPILSDKCFLCHGPDVSSRQAGLRLDLEEAARASGVLEVDTDGYSEFLDRIESADDPLYHMPPAEAHLALTERERQHLSDWVRAGAPYEPHWAFEPLPAEVPVPSGVGDGWARGDIDRWVAAGHRAQGLTPAAAASPARWLRRVTYDLTGLPPTTEELDAFLSDPSDAQREATVDRLLASPRFGEHMATAWLDVARYADSYGYQSDQLSPTWPYRDWVVRALNAGMGYDDFLTAQIAGDLLPEATVDQRLATAFQRLHRMTNEGGSVESEWRHAYVVDRVETLGSAVMGLTLGCARCHDHKYDPIAQSEFYGLFAFFNSIDEWGMYHDSSRVPTPSLLLPSAADALTLAGLDEQVAALDERIAELESKGAQRTPATEVARFGFDGAPDGVMVFTGDDAHGLPGVSVDYSATTPFSLACRLWIPEGLDDGVILHRTGGSDVGYFGFDLVLMGGELLARQVRFWPGNAAAIGVSGVPRGEWVDVVYSQGGTGRAAEMDLWVNGARVGRVVRDGLEKLPNQGGGDLTLGARFRGPGFVGGKIDEVVLYAGRMGAEQVARLGAGGEGALATEVDATLTARLRELTEERRAAVAKRFALKTPMGEISVMAELSDPRPAYTLDRGAYDAPRSDSNRAPRQFPAALVTEPVDRAQPLDRLDLAHWLTSERHPLTARVAVNRIWQGFFGVGMVSTPGDFGLQGTQPSNASLLDGLARSFVRSGWDTKGLCKSIVLSATYGQDSVPVDEAQRALDPDNVWLARGPATRLSAEMLRDTALFVAGLLEEQLGGPPVSPYQPPGLWRESNSMSPAYRESVGDDLYRRSLYSVVKRTAPLPNMVAFDKPMREFSCARRESTATPLQGLVLLNDVQFVEAAAAAAARCSGDTEDLASAVDLLFRRFTGRHPDAFELATLLELVGAGGELTLAAQTILALDATTWKR